MPLAAGIAMSANTVAADTNAVGKYCWRVVYDGADPDYNAGSHSNDGNECFTTVPFDPVITTLSVPTGSPVALGAPVHDTVLVTGGSGPASGSVDFYLCGPSATTGGVISAVTGCAGGTQIGGSVPLDPGTAMSANTAAADTNVIGIYCWRVVYDGADPHYNSGSHSNDGNECFTVVPQNPVITTLSSPNNNTVVPGTPASDTATITGTVVAGVPGGTVSFWLCGPAPLATTANPATGCLVDGTQIGGAIPVVDQSTTPPSSAATSASTTSAQTMGIGLFCWRAVYSGAGNYNAGPPPPHTNNGTECFQTVLQPVTIDTVASETDIFIGAVVTDLATVSASGSGPQPTGFVEFFLCGPDQGDPVTGDGCPVGGASIEADVALAELGGTPAIAQATSVAAPTDLVPGIYCWAAEYSGDGFYESGRHSNDTTECFTVHVIEGRFTGGGSIFHENASKTITARLTRGFQLHCGEDPGAFSNNLQVNAHRFGDKINFHLTELIFADCYESTNPNIEQEKPDAPLDTIVGFGFGTLKGVDGEDSAWICFVLRDDGEPGKTDLSTIQIRLADFEGDCDPINLDVDWDKGDDPLPLLDDTPTGPSDVLYIFGTLKNGNYQAHKQN